MFRCVMDFEAIEEASCLFWLKSFVECGGFMGVKVVAHQHNFFGGGVLHVEQVLYLMCPVGHGTLFEGANSAFSGLWLAEHKDAGGAVSFVFVVVSFRFPRFGWQGSASFRA